MPRDYLARLSRAVRWYLPSAEAAEVLEDYREIVEGRSEEALRRDLGSPWNAARQLAQPGTYRRWLAAFGALAVCVLFPFAVVHNRVYWGPTINPVYAIPLILGIGLSLKCFRPDGSRRGRLPGGITLLLALLLVVVAGVWSFAAVVLTESWEILGLFASPVHGAQTVHLLLRLGILAMALAALYGLVKARIDDFRWRGVYVLGLSGVILGQSFRLLLTSMDINGFTPGWQMPFLVWYIAVTLAGLVGTGVSLC